MSCVTGLLPVIGVFNKKIKAGARGRARTWDILDTKVKNTLPKIWVHAASLGEYEQIVPVLEKINREEYQVILSFFSPSGYENKKDTALADVIVYLPIDTADNASKFLDLVKPAVAIMIKYEYWINYLNESKKRDIKTIMVSGVFREKNTFNSLYGSWMRPYLASIDYFFLQNESSLYALKNMGFTNAVVSGDTRYDRAAQLIERDNTIEKLELFIGEQPCIVIGSSWPEDIAIMKDWLQLNEASGNYAVIIAPHEVDKNAIHQLQRTLNYNTALWSDDNASNEHTSTLILDTIGLLTKAYSYAQIAYVGGAMGSKGLHNILEAATYGIPVIIGKNYEKFPEAGKLEDLGGLFSIKNTAGFESIVSRLLSDDYLRDKTGMICGHWINSNTGATRAVLSHLKSYDEKMVLP